MVVLLIVIAAVVVLAVVLGLGGFGGFGGYDGPVVRRRIYYRRRPVQRVYTEHHVVEEAPPVDGPVYRP